MGRKPVGKKFSVTIPFELVDKLELMAKTERRSLSQTIMYLVEKGLETVDKQDS